MKLVHMGLLFLLPVGLMGCGSNTDTATTDNSPSTTKPSASTTSDNTASDKTSTTDGKVTPIGTSGVEVTVPATWKTETKTAGTVECTSADGALTVLFQPIDTAANAAKIIKPAMDAIKSASPKDYKEDGPVASRKVGALDSQGQSGTTKDKGVENTWAVDTVKGKTPVVILMVDPTQAKDKNAAEYAALMDSVKEAG